MAKSGDCAFSGVASVYGSAGDNNGVPVAAGPVATGAAAQAEKGGAIQGAEEVRFTGKERDAETGLDYFGARYYSGAQGRFTSVDPAMESEDVADPHLHLEMKFNLLFQVAIQLAALLSVDHCSRARFSHSMSLALRRSHHARDGERQTAPAKRLGGEVFAPGGGEAIKLRAAVVGRDSPLGVEETAQFKAMQGLVERAFLHQQNVLRSLLNRFGNVVPVLSAASESPQNHHVERTWKQLVGPVVIRWHPSVSQGNYATDDDDNQ